MMTQAKTYCYEKAAPPHSALYYSLRKLSSKQRDLVVGVHAFYQEIEDVVLTYHDSDLARTKLNWWRGEVCSFANGDPQHPVTVLLKDHTISPEKLLTIIDAMEENLMPAPFDVFEDVVIHLMRTAGQREELIYSSLAPEVIYQFMLVIELVNYLQHLRTYVRRDIIYFPLDELAQFKVSNSMLREFKTTDEIKNLLKHQTEKINRAYSNALEKLSREQRAVLSNLLIRCEMAMATLREIEASGFCVLENLIKLTPLRYWWIAVRK